MTSETTVDYEWELDLQGIQKRIPEAKEIISRAVVLRIGWEMDNEVCAVEMMDGSRILVGTSHGGVYEIEPKELQEYMENYRTALTQSEAVLNDLGRKEA